MRAQRSRDGVSAAAHGAVHGVRVAQRRVRGAAARRAREQASMRGVRGGEFARGDMRGKEGVRTMNINAKCACRCVVYCFSEVLLFRPVRQRSSTTYAPDTAVKERFVTVQVKPSGAKHHPARPMSRHAFTQRYMAKMPCDTRYGKSAGKSQRCLRHAHAMAERGDENAVHVTFAVPIKSQHCGPAYTRNMMRAKCAQRRR